MRRENLAKKVTSGVLETGSVVPTIKSLFCSPFCALGAAAGEPPGEDMRELWGPPSWCSFSG